jgi:hypothetical protein
MSLSINQKRRRNTDVKKSRHYTSASVAENAMLSGIGQVTVQSAKDSVGIRGVKAHNASSTHHTAVPYVKRSTRIIRNELGIAESATSRPDPTSKLATNAKICAFVQGAWRGRKDTAEPKSIAALNAKKEI